MANICTTTYIITGNDDEMKKLADLLKKHYFDEDGMAKMRYPDISEAFSELTGEEDDSYGGVNYVDIDYKASGKIVLDIDTKWSRNDRIEQTINEYFPGLAVYFESEEFGCGIFETNDCSGTYFPRPYYYISSFDDDEYCEGDEELISKTNEFFDTKFKSIDECLEFYEKHQNDEKYDSPYLYTMELA